MMNEIMIIGLGAGDIEQLPYGIYKTLKQADHLFLRTKEHPVVEQLIEEGISFQSFDVIYEKHDQFEAVYEEIAETLIDKATISNIVYAVPGHPMIAEKTVQLLLERNLEDIKVTIGGGQSFLDGLFTAVKVDPIDGFQLLDGTSLALADIHIHQHLIIAQVYDSFIASDVKLTLMEKYPDDYEVTIVTSAGGADEKLEKVPLYEIDRKTGLNNLTSLYVPPVTSQEMAYQEFSTLREIIAELRGPNGCPWDKEQTHSSLKKYLIEEAYELLDAIDRDDIDNMIEELGDVLLQVMLHSQIGEDDGMFSIEDVIESISAKMVRRHPHVFAKEQVESTEEVLSNWEDIKAAEKAPSTSDSALLDKVSGGFPAMLRANEYQKTAARVGFDWTYAKDAWEKVKEEMQEFADELENGNRQKQLDEFGDLLFAMINVARLLDIHPEEALQMANEKFYRRFSYVEAKVLESGRLFNDFTLDELDLFWNEAKRLGL
ncbi:nucleoside triphosphate pyrophosphohydrolase [Pseudogracilibacillus auburnensis]|uniref:nucleoside triphosphate pyrophosphohydrolase n=1 Tax=Pseudogracilibacillus auburnensis TaxID=1494959 RepID=UPI001A96020D|nr:nucleoside triphosphate pyrophosphohydrolase [Pseudogracilibacillus auburnensis]MBO1004716.1 nucleoside triphosphate pyrophosphohydrolase [Pseudogracilibacillus auburnensis]